MAEGGQQVDCFSVEQQGEASSLSVILLLVESSVTEAEFEEGDVFMGVSFGLRHPSGAFDQADGDARGWTRFLFAVLASASLCPVHDSYIDKLRCTS